jgi:hypothetical protein
MSDPIVVKVSMRREKKKKVQKRGGEARYL